MIIWINGAFGSGKTTIANLLHERMEGSYIYDPEELGSFFMRNLPASIQLDNFQDYHEWRLWNKQLLEKMLLEYHGAIIVPMTMYNPTYIEDIFGSLRSKGYVVHHVQLEVTKEKIIQRLIERNDGTLAWGKSKVDEILASYSLMKVEEKIDNNDRNPSDVVDEILARLY